MEDKKVPWYEKLLNFLNNYICSFKKCIITFLIAILPFTFALCALDPLQGNSYPEQDYIAMEKEAVRIITTNDFNTSYHYEITSYDNQTNSLTMKMHLNDTYISLYAQNLNSDNLTYSIDREFSSRALKIFCYVLCYVLTACLLSFLLMLLIAAFTFTLPSILTVKAKIRKKRKERKERKK